MLLVALLFVVGTAEAFQPPLSLQRKRYDGYKVLSIFPQDEGAVKLLRNLMISDVETDFWQEPSYAGNEVSLMLSPTHRPAIEQMLSHAGIPFTYQIDDVQSLLTPMWNSIDARQVTPEKMVFDIEDFNTLDDINAWLASLVANCRTGLTCELYSIGNSFQGRPINVFKISKAGAGRKAYWIDATIHAREWIATATILKIINNLATGGDAAGVRLADDYDWYLLPVLNPDGYSYTWTNDRMWRKNRRQNTGSTCVGTDLNRNYDWSWGKDGVSFNPCSDTFCGSSGGSEVETQAVSAELNRVGSTLAALLTLHSYARMWMFPWGNTVNYAGTTCELATDHQDMLVVANAAADAVQATYSTSWARGSSCVVIYATSGSSQDYAKGVSGVKYSFTAELRGTSFIIDKSNITPSYNEVWNGVVAMVDSINA